MPDDLPSGQPEFPPLLPTGLHTMTIPALRQMCSGNFPLSATRADTMAGLEQITDRLHNDAIVGEIWVDGSFLTEKIDPADVDIVLRIQADVYDNGTPQQRAAIDWLDSDLKGSHHCDSYFFMEYPPGHRLHSFGQDMYDYWMRQWGVARDNVMKGIAVLLLPRTDK